MRYKTIKSLALILSALFIASALFAGVSSVQGKQLCNKNPKPRLDFNGPHYTLNILGKNNIGNGQYDNPDRHTIFVPLEGDTTITYALGDYFGVLDGNGLDDGECTLQIPHGKDKNFMVYLVSLGKPGDGAEVDYADNWTYDNETNQWYCQLESFSIKGHTGKSEWMNITDVFFLEYYYSNATLNQTGLIWEGYLWNVPQDLYGLTGYFWLLKGEDKHIQVRFYPY